ncbi:leucine-rich repeat domain-containing protein [Listeria marthii]|uniref:leucine-rich repeat domain-containing protein n=1 Tax=Listeria marthii TaxID=529731 RepID=UPI001E56E15E|nr:leucine-rich repeat domain-containing protein [Listeria marthii]MCD2254259.1 leucine-rich repeat domain-containing protein [Listeria marthii]
MKKTLITIALALTMILSFNLSAQADKQLVPDANLRLAINQSLGQADTHEPTQAEIATIETLSISGYDVTSLEGLQYATNLKELFANHNDISDFSPISNLTGLTKLQIDETKITDTKQLINLVNLTELDISSNNLNEIDGVKNMTKLESLFAYNNNISDLSPLANCAALVSVDFINNEITDVSIFQNLDNLETGRFAYNHISNISYFRHDIPHAGNLNFDNQTITLPTQRVSLVKKSLTMVDPIKGAAGQNVTLANISNSDTFANKELSFVNLAADTNQVTYDFDHFFTYNNYYMNFSGTVTQPLEWFADNAPVIHVDDIVIDQNSSFDPTDYITADDEEDGDITDKIVIIENNVNPAVPGTYDIIISVTDADGNVTEKTVTVTVEETAATPANNDTDKSTPQTPTKDTTLVVTDKQTAKTATPSNTTTTNNTTNLPKTGDNSADGLVVLGGLLLLSSAFLLRRKY